MSNFKTILIATTVLTSLSFAPAHAEKVVVGGPAQEAATQLLQHASKARYSLASKDSAGAKAHVEKAKTAGQKLAQFSAEKRRVTGIQSGRVSYEIEADNDDQDEFYYYPVEQGTVTTKDVDTGPFWSSNKGLAVKDAEVLYVTVDVSKADVQKELNEALTAISKNDLDDADDALEDLIEDMVVVEDRKEALAIKAKDNLALASDYLAAKNYDAARYPLKHAKSALEDMKGNDRYAADQPMVIRYLKEIDRSEAVIAKKDPNAIEKLQQGWNKNWTEFKNWADKKVN